MKKSWVIGVFALLLGGAVFSCIDSMVRTGRRAQLDVNRALALTLQECSSDRIDTDTIRVYRSHILTPEVRDTAYLSLALTEEGTERKASLRASTGLTVSRLWSLSDQRASGALGALAGVWLALSLCFLRKTRQAIGESVQLGILQYDELQHRFYVRGHEVHFTPMQLSLMELFMAAPDHRLLQRDICDRLWPKKPDASATLYTLIRRLKPILANAASLNIECQRGESYQLITA